MPDILENNGIIIDINDIFLDLTEFNKEDLLDKHISHVWTNLLRINVQLNSIHNETELILFTKSLDVRFVTMQKYNNKDNEIIYIFSENLALRLENKLQFL